MVQSLIEKGIINEQGVNGFGFREFLRIKDGAVLISIPEGHSKIGSRLEIAEETEMAVPWYKASVAEMPQILFFQQSYLIDKFPITNAQFCVFLNEKKYSVLENPDLRNTLSAQTNSGTIICYDSRDFILKRGISNSNHDTGVVFRNDSWEPNPEKGNFPVVLVTWQGAMEYAKWAGATLPDEFQWEKAARGESGQLYPWGNIYSPSKINTADRWNNTPINNQEEWLESFYNDGKGKGWLNSQPSSINCFPEGDSPYGCSDMIGNVAEWCYNWYHEDFYGTIKTKNDINLRDLPPSEFKSMRGAGRYGYKQISRCACRRRRAPQTISENLGFRCCIQEI